MTRTAPVWALLGFFVIGCGDDSPAADASVGIDAAQTGTLSLSWTIEDDDGNALSCADVAALTVRITSIRAGAGAGDSNGVPCDDGAATITLPAATYTIGVELIASSGRLAGPQSSTGVVVAVGQDTSLGAHTFAVVPRGSFRFTLDTEWLGENCDPVDGDLSAVTLELRDQGGTCIPTSFVIAEGASHPAATYTNDCTGAPPVLECVENDQEITVSEVASGPHRLVVRGAYGGVADCYRADSQFSIPGNDLVRDLAAIRLDVAAQCLPGAADAGVDAGDADAGVDAGN